MDETHRKHIGQMVKIIRQSRKLTTHELGVMINTDAEFIENIESGLVNVSIDVLVMIAEKLRCVIDIKMTPIKP